jgi:hypothetical protein
VFELPDQSIPYEDSFGAQYLTPKSRNLVNTSGRKIFIKLKISQGLPSIGVPVSNKTF